MKDYKVIIERQINVHCISEERAIQLAKETIDNEINLHLIDYTDAKGVSENILQFKIISDIQDTISEEEIVQEVKDYRKQQKTLIRRNMIKMIFLKSIENISDITNEDLIVIHNELQRDSLHNLENL